MRSTKSYLGCQIWLELDDSAKRVDHLVRMASEAGLGWLRIFLMWPWIEATPDNWDFGVFDRVFESAARYDIKIKATLTANSGPWHIGTPSLLHSHTGFQSDLQRQPMRRYILACVNRYATHPALGQWILWNEPNSGADRTVESRRHWQSWLQAHYGNVIERLNQRWRTGYQVFSEIPFPEEIPIPAHKDNIWNSYAPWLADWQSRAAWLTSELEWIKAIIREVDPSTECCVNPTEVLSNQAAGGTDLEQMGQIVEIIGASYHPAWHFTFADRQDFPALMVAGVRLEASVRSVRRVEVTEVQSGNTLNSSNRPSDVTPAELARFYLAGIVAGAESVTGWCLNVRSYDFEAGDWGLLDNLDQPSPRSRMLTALHQRLNTAFAQTGEWRPVAPRAWVGIDPHSQALEWIEGMRGVQVRGRLIHDGANGAALIAARLMGLGIPTTLARVNDLPERAVQSGDMIIVSHLVGWSTETAARLLAFAESGGCLLIDGTSGRKDLDARLHRPWPGGLAERIGLRAADLQTRPEGYGLLLNGLLAGRSLLTRLVPELDTNWGVWPDLRFEYDGAPCVYERPFGQGRILLFRGMLGPSLVHERASGSAFSSILKRAGVGLAHVIRPAGSHPSTFVVPVTAEKGTLTAVFAPDALDRGGRAVYLQAPLGTYHDFWSGEAVQTVPEGELVLAAPDGIALLWPLD